MSRSGKKLLTFEFERQNIAGCCKNHVGDQHCRKPLGRRKGFNIFLLLKVLPKLGLLYYVDKSSTIPTVGITKSGAFGALILVKYFYDCRNNQK